MALNDSNINELIEHREQKLLQFDNDDLTFKSAEARDEVPFTNSVITKSSGSEKYQKYKT